MRGDELLDVLEHIDPILIEEADRKPKSPWLRYTAVAACLALVIGLCGFWLMPRSSPQQKKYKRISFESETLGSEPEGIGEDVIVTNVAKETFSQQMPVYEISKRSITENEHKRLGEVLGVENWYHDGYDDGEIHSLLAPYNDPKRGYFYQLNLSDEQLEEMAWETFNKIPFMEGEYEYIGITSTYTVWTMNEGEIVQAVMVSFRRVLDGVRVVGSEMCDLTFDGSGLQELHISLYDYKKIGTMDMVTLEQAEEKVNAPDAFSMKKEGTVKLLQVDRVNLLLVNQYSRGCAILQPIYTFIGNATLEDGTQTEFSSKVIAIPESMTYEYE